LDVEAGGIGREEDLLVPSGSGRLEPQRLRRTECVQAWLLAGVPHCAIRAKSPLYCRRGEGVDPGQQQYGAGQDRRYSTADAASVPTCALDHQLETQRPKAKFAPDGPAATIFPELSIPTPRAPSSEPDPRSVVTAPA